MDSNSNIWWLGPLGLTVLRLLYVEARLTHARVKGKLLVFSAGLGIRLLFGAAIIGFSALTAWNIGREETWLLVMMAVIVVAVCFGWPATITIGELGIKRHLWWRPTLAVPWNEVSGIEKNAGGDIQVFGDHGQCITFTRFHVDLLAFRMK
jgi:hypothetical protein